MLSEKQEWNAEQVLTEAYPQLTKTSPKAFLPIYKYLSQVDKNSDESYKSNKLGINYALRKGPEFQSYNFSDEEKKLSLEEILAKYKGSEVWKVVALIPYISIDEDDFNNLREFIERYFNDFLIKHSNYSTHMRKLICFYDWKKYG